MPRLLLALLMTALLVLRGGIGDAMALEMLAQHGNGAGHATDAAMHAQHAPLAAAEAPAPHDLPCHEAGAAAPANQAGAAHAAHAGAPPHDGADAQQQQQAQQHNGCETCGACQVCHGSAIALGSVPALPPAATPAAPRLQDARFASADPVHRHKPPIS